MAAIAGADTPARKNAGKRDEAALEPMVGEKAQTQCRYERKHKRQNRAVNGAKERCGCADSIDDARGIQVRDGNVSGHSMTFDRFIRDVCYDIS